MIKLLLATILYLHYLYLQKTVKSVSFASRVVSSDSSCTRNFAVISSEPPRINATFPPPKNSNGTIQLYMQEIIITTATFDYIDSNTFLHQAVREHETACTTK